MSAARLKAWRLAQRLGFGALVAAVVAFSVGPFLYCIATSLKSGTALFDATALPTRVDLSNYRTLFEEQPFAKSLLNSVVVASAVVGLSLVLGVTSAHAFARLRFRGRRVLLLCVLGVSMFPQVAVLSGLFQLVQWLGLYNSKGALVFSYVLFTLPFTVWVLTTFMRELPRELEEAAVMDGAGQWTILTRVFLPLLWPALVTTGLLAFIAAWNEFLFALTFVLSNEHRTVPVAIALISGASAHELPWGVVMAASVVVTLPLVLVVLAFQRRIVAGLTAGSVKG